MLLNEDKTKYIKISGSPEQDNSLLEVGEYRFGVINECKYLGVTIPRNNKVL